MRYLGGGVKHFGTKVIEVFIDEDEMSIEDDGNIDTEDTERSRTPDMEAITSTDKVPTQKSVKEEDKDKNDLEDGSINNDNGFDEDLDPKDGEEDRNEENGLNPYDGFSVYIVCSIIHSS